MVIYPILLVEGVSLTHFQILDTPEAQTEYWYYLKAVQPNGPLVNSEFYPGWLTHWQEVMWRIETQPVGQTLRFD